MKKAILLLLAIALSGCTYNNSTQEAPTISLNEYFNENMTTYSEQLIGYYIDCLNGSCPDEGFNPEAIIRDCWFCGSEYNGIKGDNFKVAMGVTGGADTFAGCTKNNILDEIFDEFEILEKTESKIMVQINKTGTFTQSGDCDNFKYDYTLEYEWIFEKEK